MAARDVADILGLAGWYHITLTYICHLLLLFICLYMCFSPLFLLSHYLSLLCFLIIVLLLHFCFLIVFEREERERENLRQSTGINLIRLLYFISCA